MTKKIILVIIALVLVFGLAACSKGYTDISNAELTEMLLSNPEYQFIDVRMSEEFYEERIPGFTNMDFYILEDDYSILDNLDKNIPVVLMCNSGNRSSNAAKIFADEGFEKVYNLENGIQNWTGITE